jgi:diacylglycerol kinase family enzyme
MTAQRQIAPNVARRVAAFVALAAPIVTLAASLEVTVQHAGDLVALMLSIAVVTVSAWYALSRRGVLRAGAVIAAVLAAAAIVLVGLSLFLLQMALLAVFVAAGRYALGPDAGALSGDHRPARSVGPARNGVLLINPRSGNATAVRLNLAAEAAGRGIRVITLAAADDLARLAERAAADGADVLGMAGGDGSQAVVAAAAVRHGIAYACVPSGTRNHFALDLGLDRDDPLRALDAFTDGVERTVDLGQVNGRVFVNNASLGVYAEVVRSGAYRGAKLRTWGRLLPDLIGPAATPPDLVFDGPDARRRTGMSLVLVSNNPYQLTRLGRAGGRPGMDSGRLGILAARMRGAAGGRRTMSPRRFADLLEFSRSDFEIRSTAPVPVGLDGEAVTLLPPLRFTSLPGVLRVRLPRHAARHGRRNAAVSRRDLTALIRILAGRPGVARQGVERPAVAGPPARSAAEPVAPTT